MTLIGMISYSPVAWIGAEFAAAKLLMFSLQPH